MMTQLFHPFTLGACLFIHLKFELSSLNYNLNRKKSTFMFLPVSWPALCIQTRFPREFYSVRTNLVGLGTAGNLNGGFHGFSTH